MMAKLLPAETAAIDPPPRQLACLLVEDHTLIAQLLAGALRAVPGIGSVILASTVAEGVAEAAERDLDLVILDLMLPDGNGRTVLEAVAAWHPEAVCIVLSSAADEFVCPQELSRRVVALIDKSEPLDTLRREVEGVVRRRLGGEMSRATLDPARLLRPRELEVFKQIGRGMTTRQIAESLGITVHTVNSHRKSIVSKLAAVGAELVRLATLYNATRPTDEGPIG